MYNEKKENITKYGEFVCTFHQWLPIAKQKENAQKMCNMTKTKINDNSKC